MVGVENDGDTVGRCDGTDVVSSGDSTLDGGVLTVVGNTLTSEVCGTTLRSLEDDRSLLVTGSLESGNNGGGGSYVDGGDGVVVLLGVLEESEDIVTDDAIDLIISVCLLSF